MNNKKLIALLLSAAMTLSLAACGGTTNAPSQTSPASPSSQSESAAAPIPSGLSIADVQPECVPIPERTTLKIAALKGPSAIGMLQLMEYGDNLTLSQSTANDYVYTLAGAPEQLAGGVISGEYDIAVLPTNLAATVYNKTGGKVKLATINTLGVLYLLEAGDTIKTVADLSGKTVYSSGKGATPQYALEYVLAQSGVKDVTVEYKSEHAEIAALFAAGQAQIALLPQPFVESVLAQNKNVRVALDWTKEWETAAKDGSSLAMSGIVIQQKLLDENPAAVDAFLAEYEASTKFVTDPANLDAVAELAVKREIIPKAAVAKKAIPQCNITYIAGNDMKTTAGGFLKVLFDANPQSVGGKLPDDAFYYIPNP